MLLGSQKVRFLLVGVVNTGIGYLLFVGLLFALGDELYVLVGIVSHLLTTTVSFGLNRKIVFGSGGHLLADYLRFQLTYTVILGINLIALIALVEYLGWTISVAQAVCLVFVAIASYAGHKYFSFHRRNPRQ